MLASIAGLCAGIAGCGASNVLTATTRDARDTISASQLSASARSVGPTTVQQAVATPSTNEPQEPTGKGTLPLNPCSLVTTAQAESITGASTVSSVEAPLGPTCIYTILGANPSKSKITLTVELTNFNQVVSQMAAATSSTIGGMQAYCGTLQRPTMFVHLPKGDVLHITAPCARATRFAADAVSALPTS